MKKQDFDKLESELLKRGYKRYNQHWHKEDYMLGLSLHREDNRWDEDRAGCQLLLSIYDYSLHPEYYDRIPKEQRNQVGIEMHINVSRTIDERMDLATGWSDYLAIEEVEFMAESFYQWVCTAYPEPHKSYEADKND